MYLSPDRMSEKVSGTTSLHPRTAPNTTEERDMTTEEISPVASAPPPPIEPFILHVPEEELGYLHDRLRRARLPEPETVSDRPGEAAWTQGIPLDYVRELCRSWLEDHDWRRLESELNRRGQWRAEI